MGADAPGEDWPKRMARVPMAPPARAMTTRQGIRGSRLLGDPFSPRAQPPACLSGVTEWVSVDVRQQLTPISLVNDVKTGSSWGNQMGRDCGQCGLRQLAEGPRTWA